MLTKYKTLSMTNKSMIWTMIYSLIALIIGLVLLCLSPYWLYGVLMGLGIVLITSLINYLMLRIPAKGKMYAIGMPNIALAIRIVLFITMLFLTIFVINPSLVDGKGTFDQIYLFKDINIFMMLFVYLIPMYSYFTVGFIDMFLKEK